MGSTELTMNTMSVLSYFMLLLSAFTATMASFRFIHMLQLESYQGKMYLKWLFRRGLKPWFSCVSVAIMAFAISLIAIEAFILTNPDLFNWIIIAARLVYSALMYSLYLTGRDKTFKLTPRVKRLAAALFVIVLAAAVLPKLLGDGSVTKWQYVGTVALTYLPGLLLPLAVFAAYIVMYPVEEAIKRRYLNEAKAILNERADLIRIGITGSYGKTSAKFILGTLLAEKFNVLVPPSSYNTPMGLTRVVREQLAPEHEVFVAEMGARYPGDIEELCDLVTPTVGLLTAIGPQHLETFGNIANVAKTKFELIESLPGDGAAFFNADNEICNSLFDSAAVAHKHRYGVDSGEKLYVRAKELVTGPEGSAFTLCAKDAEKRVKTRLLGKHNVQNITGCCAVALYLGLTLDEIAAGLEKLEPVEHRLQLIPGAVTVIDDAFNASPEGTKAALAVLSEFEGRKIVVTPGMVELGDDEAAHNEDFGKRLAAVANEVILVGEKHTRPIFSGLLAGGFSEEHIRVVPNLAAATEALSALTKQGDVVLFENDLPANYNE